MGDNRAPGRYNLHRLGWSAFEDLCMQVMRVVLGETCSRFRPGPDGGRDGWFSGQASNLLVSQDKLSGGFVVQCKHTSLAHDPLSEADLKTDISNVALAAAKQPLNYILITNRQVSAPSEKLIREKVESISGVLRCLVLSETWIEDTIDAHPRLLRLVPRLYGIGDLSQILSSTIEKQTTAILEDLANSLRTFVPTESYRRAETALNDHGFVVLVGPPASGKSAIAANLCLVRMAQDPNERIMRIEHADQFKTTWSPADAHTIYWVDDVFGETTLDEDRLKEWSAALDKVEAARKRGSKVIFCTRDYILSAAEHKLKRSKADLINDARVRIDVSDLSDGERDGILYNHIKDGDITKLQKTRLKKYLSHVARLKSFSPELARRLGSRKLNRMSPLSRQEVERFFNEPVQHFKDIIHGLSAGEKSALAVCLLSNNAVVDPIPDNALAKAVLDTFGVTMQEVREAFEMLAGSLVKRVRSGTRQTWQLHHPSMIEALQDEFSAKPSQLLLYIQSAKINAVLRDTTTALPEPGSRFIFLPESVYPQLIERFRTEDKNDLDAITSYLTGRSSDRLLVELNQTCPELIDEALTLTSYPNEDTVSARFAVRLSKVTSVNLLGDARREMLISNLAALVTEYGTSAFLDVDGFDVAVPGVIGNFIAAEVDNNFASVEKLYEWYADDLSTVDHINATREALVEHVGRLRRKMTAAGSLTETMDKSLATIKAQFEERLQERESTLLEEQEQEADFHREQLEESRYEERYELEKGRFADVDE